MENFPNHFICEFWNFHFARKEKFSYKTWWKLDLGFKAQSHQGVGCCCCRLATTQLFFRKQGCPFKVTTCTKENTCNNCCHTHTWDLLRSPTWASYILLCPPTTKLNSLSIYQIVQLSPVKRVWDWYGKARNYMHDDVHCFFLLWDAKNFLVWLSGGLDPIMMQQSFIIRRLNYHWWDINIWGGGG